MPTPDTGPPPPACTIEFIERDFSLPFGLPHDLPDAASLQAYVAATGLQVGVLRYQGMTAASPTQDPADPGPPYARRAQACGGASPTLFPSSTWMPEVALASPVTVTKPQLDSVGKMTWHAAVPTGSATTAEVAGSTFRWDKDARKAFGLPMPTFTEESLVAFWPAEPAGGPTLTAADNGILDDDDATYLLTTPTTAQQGELDGLLLRAPAFSLIRFERYRHLRQASASTLTTSHPSNSGAVVMRTAVSQFTGNDDRAPLFQQNVLVFENVTVESASDAFGALAYGMVVWYDRLNIEDVQGSLNSQLTWLFRTWLAYLAVVRPLLAPGDPDVTSEIDPATRQPFEQAGTPTSQAIGAFVSAVLSSANAKASLRAFASNIYGPLLCGVSWTELGADLPADPASRPANLAYAHQAIERIMSAPDAYLVAYAGCPVGAASPVYLQTSNPSAEDIPLTALTEFDLEGLLIAGYAGTVWPDVAPPGEPGVLEPYDLSAYGPKAGGFMAALRVVDATAGKHPFTALEWTSETVKGSNRNVFEDPQFDFTAMASASHALVQPLGWDYYTQAQQLRDQLDTLNEAMAGGVSLNQAIVDWWVARTNLATGGAWPDLEPFSGGPTLVPAGPSDAFIPGDTRAVSGFDVYDLATVLEVADSLVADAKNPPNPPPLALFLALLDREGYRALARTDRRGGLIGAQFTNAGNPQLTASNLALASVPSGQATNDSAARLDWILFPYGLDIFNKTLTVDANFVASVRTSFTSHLDQLTGDQVYKSALTSAYAHQYAIARLAGRVSPANGREQNLHLSRRLQLLGIACQQAEFQDRHHLLQSAGNAGSQFTSISEYVAATAPSPGTDANSADRRAFIAYYALMYLAFNVSPATFNAWVLAATQNLSAGDSVSSYLTYYQNVTPGALEPTISGGEPAGSARAPVQRANMLRFAVALDAYLRIGGAEPDTADPSGRTW